MKWYTTDVKPEEDDLIIMHFDHAIPYLRSNQRYELGYYQKEFSFSTFLSWITQESLILTEEDIACWAKIEEPEIVD